MRALKSRPFYERLYVAFAAVLSVVMVFSLCFMLVNRSVPVFADVTDTATYAEAVKNQLQADFGNEKYETSGGGYYKVGDLLTNADPSHPNMWVINEAAFSSLTSGAQSNFMSDLNTTATAVVEKDTTSTYSSETQTNWYKVLQTQQGVGTKFMNVLLENVKPDYVTANRIMAPFSGLLGTILGLGSILIMSVIAIVILADIMYIALPPFRLFMSDDENGGMPKSKIISHDAIYAVQKAEGDTSGNGSPKMALAIYFKRRVLTLIVLGICLMYLVSGQIYTFVGYILDLVSGFL